MPGAGINPKGPTETGVKGLPSLLALQWGRGKGFLGAQGSFSPVPPLTLLSV